MSPSVAVVMPVRNGMPFLPEAIASVRIQHYSPLELIIVDDESTDGSKEFARQDHGIPARLLECDSVGPAAARNAGIAASNSDMVAFLDADDLWVASGLSRLVHALAAQPDAGIAQGLIRNFSESLPGNRQFVTASYRFLNLGATVWRRQVLQQIGPLDESLRLCEDMDLLMRCWEKDIRKADVNSITLHYRRHPGGITHGLSGAGFGTIQAYKKRMDRIRCGELNPELPRHMPLTQYLGSPPAHQDGSLRANAQ